MPTGLGDEQLWLSATNDNTGTSTAFNDQSGEGNNGTATGTLVVADTSEGGTYAFDLDGVDDRIESPAAFVSGMSTGAFSMWFKASSASTGSRSALLASTEVSGSLNNMNYCTIGPSTGSFADESLEMVLWSGTGTASLSAWYRNGTNFFYDDTWHHFVYKSDPSGNGIYVDGVLVSLTYIDGSSSDNKMFGDNLSKLWFGGRPLGSGGLFLDGMLDDIRIFDRPLTQSEITHLAEARGIEGPPPVGLGDEQLWLCPSLNDSAADISGSGNDGTYNGGMGTVADVSNGGSRCYDFDGTDDYIDISGFAANTSAYSVSCWIDGTGPNQTIVAFNSGESSGGRATNIGLQPSGTALAGHQNGGSSYWAESTSSVNGSGWKHVTCTFDGSTVEIFIDGVSEDTQAAPVTNKTQALAYIGRWIGSTPFWLTGKMDDIRAYNRALTQAEITHLATSRGIEGGPSTSATLIASTSKGGASGGVSTNTIDTTGADMICVNVATYNKLGTTVTDSEGNTWSALTVDVNSIQRNGIFYCMNPTTSSTHTFTYNESQSYPSISVMVFSGVAAFDSEATSTQSGASTAILAGQVTPPTDNCLLIACGGSEGGTISSVDSGFVLQEVNPYLAFNHMGNMAAYLNQSTASTVNPEFTGTTSGLKSASVAVFTTTGGATHYNAFLTHAFKQLFQTRLR